MRRTRIKICGLTRAEDVAAACALGADAVGFVCFEGSPRWVPPAALAGLAATVAPFVMPVLLFVDAAPEQVRTALAAVPHALLQFHGAESAADCERWGRPYLKAVAMAPGVDLLDWETTFTRAAGLLVDAPAAGGGFGGSGRRFDWSLVPPVARRARPLVLAGGLDATQVAAAIAAVAPAAVDVSSGVELARGIKSAAKMQAFITAVRAADAAQEDP